MINDECLCSFFLFLFQPPISYQLSAVSEHYVSVSEPHVSCMQSVQSTKCTDCLCLCVVCVFVCMRMRECLVLSHGSWWVSDGNVLRMWQFTKGQKGNTASTLSIEQQCKHERLPHHFCCTICLALKVSPLPLSCKHYTH